MFLTYIFYDSIQHNWNVSAERHAVSFANRKRTRSCKHKAFSRNLKLDTKFHPYKILCSTVNKQLLVRISAGVCYRHELVQSKATFQRQPKSPSSRMRYDGICSLNTLYTRTRTERVYNLGTLGADSDS